ncbi:MAG TPA: twin-arginine translocase TatA/TatE family subunit [Anaerolineaceae bacterium]|jgi:sec-independent protein translocase protein TatA|nr:twin-arginine translocase TatA/TatE family subunit [Anaerolineaceae bacterium]HOH92815.1 twin-arginine translocase TatA/TatE family subunit [Anaerolineaceae bacterium]HQC64344.1 twin-arginine translocase TatA/TatE family subunit [Anaerolineaceae bacterium]
MPQLGIWEVLIIILIIVILFGAGRIAKAGGELGKGIRAFKEGLQGKDSETTDQDDAEIDSAKEDK